MVDWREDGRQEEGRHWRGALGSAGAWRGGQSSQGERMRRVWMWMDVHGDRGHMEENQTCEVMASGSRRRRRRRRREMEKVGVLTEAKCTRPF